MADESAEQRVSALMKEERWQEAIEAADRALVDAPENGVLLWSAGWARFRLEKPAEAIPFLRKSVDAEPAKAAHYWALGVAFGEAEDTDAAELWLLRALAMRDSALCRLSLAVIYQKQNLWEVAEAIHHEGLRLRPTSANRLEAYADFLSDAGRESEAQQQRSSATALRETTSAPRRESD